jgi:hypothetical protein
VMLSGEVKREVRLRRSFALPALRQFIQVKLWG